jgi:phage terminase Nu1 subunit (DNA packaging protein)
LPDDDFTTAQVCEALGVKPALVKQWRDQGMPAVRIKNSYHYDPFAVEKWLIDQGIATRVEDEEELDDDTSPIFKSRSEIAEVFGVSTRSVAAWLEDPSFPGRVGERATSRGGYFPARAIARWLRANGKRAVIPPGLVDDEPQPEATGASINPRDRLARIRGDKAELELNRLQGQLISAEEVKAYCQRCWAYAQSTLNELPHVALAELPHDLDERAKRVVFKVSQRVVKNKLLTISDLLTNDPDAENG